VWAVSAAVYLVRYSLRRLVGWLGGYSVIRA
jgi:hypothetical protein